MNLDLSAFLDAVPAHFRAWSGNFAGLKVWLLTLFYNPFALYGTTIITLVFFALYYRLLLPFGAARRSANRATHFLSRRLSSQQEPPRELLQQLVEWMRRIEKRRLKRIRPVLAAQLEHFERDWRDNVITGLPGPQVSTAHADDYASLNAILPRGFNRNVSRIVPGVLTTLGILGTFVGLSTGVSGLAVGFGQGAAEVDSMREGVLQLMQGLSTAFWTSIFGLSLALLWAFLDRFCTKRAETASHQLCMLLERMFPSIADDSVARYSLQIATEQKDTLKSMSTDIATKLIEGLEASIERKVLPGLSQMTESIDRMATNTSEIQVEGIERLIQKFGDTLGDRMKDQFDNLAQTIESLCQWQRETKDNLDEIIKKLTQTTEKQDEMIAKSMDAAGLFQNSLAELALIHDKLASVLGSFQEISEQTSALEKSMAQAQDAMSANTKELSNTLSETMREMTLLSQEYQRGINQQTEKIEGLTRATLEQASTLDERLRTSMEKFREDAAKGVELTFSEFDKYLGNLAQTLSGTVQEIEETVRQVSEKLQDMNDTSVSLATIMADLNENVSKFAEAVNSINSREVH